jgi:hypothetical protein
MSRAILTLTLLVAVLGITPLAVAIDGEKATYLGGSVVTIPRYKEMTLDLADAQNLKFHYDKTSFSLAYDRIVSMELGRSGARGVRVKSLPVWFKKDSPAITIRFKNSEDVDQVMVLALSNRDTLSAVPVLEARTGKQVVNAAHISNPEDSGWWGDRYWKIERNADVWARRAEQNAAPGK